MPSERTVAVRGFGMTSLVAVTVMPPTVDPAASAVTLPRMPPASWANEGTDMSEPATSAAATALAIGFIGEVSPSVF